MSSPAHLVVINDDPAQLRLLVRILEGSGFEVSAYTDPVKALTDLPRLTGVALCIIDLHMPVIDGWKVCRLLRSPDFRALNDTPILVVSATFTGFEVEQITADLGADAFLPSPFRSVDLLTHVEDLLAGKIPARRSRVLVVEDDASVSRAVARAFDSNGFDTYEASTIQEGVVMWDEVRPDVVIIDYHLPDGTCENLLRKCHSSDGQAVALVMTGDPNPTLPVTIFGLGADGYVRKPFDPTFLVELAARARRERSLLRIEAVLESRTQELRTSEVRFRTLFDSIPDLVFALDRSNAITAVNRAATRTLCLDRDELVGRAITDIVSDSDAPALSREIDSIRTTGQGGFQATLATRSGAPLTVEVTASWPDRSEEGPVLLVARDITERMQAEEERARLEEQVHHTQRLESLGVLAGGIAHDFNNLLVGMLGNAELALLDAPKDGMLHDCLVQVQTAAQRAAELTNQILTFSGRGKTVFTTLHLSDLVSEMGRLLEQAVSPNATVTYHLQDDLPAIEGDQSQIGQVVMNLIMNASDSLESGEGEVRIETTLRHLSDSDLRSGYLGAAARPGTYACLTVRDEGCGIDETLLPRMFDPFFTTKPGGRGLGLAATLGIARAHRGLVTVDSQVNVGTTISIFFPVAEEAAEADDSDREGGGSEWLNGGTILVVDDEPAVRQVASQTLRRSGFEVLEAAGGAEGLAAINEHPDIDLVLLDIMMPGHNGIEVLEEIRRNRPYLPVLLSSGYASDTLPDNVNQAGRTAFLHKPYRPTDLVAAISGLLHSARRGGGPESQHSSWDPREASDA